MSNFIDRRTFLKNTGLVVLSAAAASALAGCGGGASATPPKNPTYNGTASELPVASFEGFELRMDALEGKFVSDPLYEEDHLPHTYLYAAVIVDTSNRNACTLKLDQFHCDDFGTVCSLGTIGLKSDNSGFAFKTEWSIPGGISKATRFLYIDIGQMDPAALPVPFSITVSEGQKSAKFQFSDTFTAPTLTTPTLIL